MSKFKIIYIFLHDGEMHKNEDVGGKNLWK